MVPFCRAVDTEKFHRALDPSTPFISINIRDHTATIWSADHYKLTFTTLPTAADAVRRILLSPAATKNRVVPVHNFEASQLEVVSLLEKVQGVRYEVKYLEDTGSFIEALQKRWVDSGERDIGAALDLVKAGFLLPGYGSNLAENTVWTSGNRLVGFPAEDAKLEDVVKDVVERFSALG